MHIPALEPTLFCEKHNSEWLTFIQTKVNFNVFFMEPALAIYVYYLGGSTWRM